MAIVLLVLAALFWTATHVGIAGTKVRGEAVARIGETGFRIAYSLVSVLAIWLLITAFHHANDTMPVPMWVAPHWLRWLLSIVMLFTLVLFVASMTVPNPTTVGQDKALEGEPRGIQRVTRHPMLWAFSLWALVHILGNGDVASLLFFGAFLATSLIGMPSIDAKVAQRNPERWARYAAVTSILPGAAILAGRNRLELAEIGWIPFGIGLVAWGLLLHFHGWIFGVPAMIV